MILHSLLSDLTFKGEAKGVPALFYMPSQNISLYKEETSRSIHLKSEYPLQVTDEKTTNELYGPPDATQICMPWCRDNTPTQTLLGTLTRGVILQENKGDIYATRLCQCAVFFGDKRGVLTKLER